MATEQQLALDLGVPDLSAVKLPEAKTSSPTKPHPSGCRGLAREQVIEYGARNRSSLELLEVLTGNSETAQRLWDQLDTMDQSGAIHALKTISIEELQEIAGIGPAKAATLVAAIELGKRVHLTPTPKGTIIDDPYVAVNAISQDLMDSPVEKFAILCLDIRHRLIKSDVLTVGTPTETLANPREIFRRALKVPNCTRILISHNHPSGSTSPSPEDLVLTTQVIEAGKVMGVPVLDHLILAGGTFLSLKQTTKLWSDVDF